MRKPALFVARALFAFLLAASATTSILTLVRLKRNQDLLLEALSARAQPAAVILPDPARETPPVTPATPSAPATASAATSAVTPAAAPAVTTVAEVAAVAPAVPLQPQAPAVAASMAAVLTAPPPADPELDLALQQEASGALRFFEEARYAEASRLFAAVLARRPEDLQARQYYAASLYRANPGASANYPEIGRHLQQVLHAQPDNAQALLLLGQVNAERECWSEALGCFQRALALRPDDPEGLRLAGMCALYCGELETAEEYFLRACALNAKAAESWHLLALARARAGKLEPAVAGFRRCLELDPGYQEARLRAGLALLELGRPQEAREVLREYVRFRPGAEGWTALGDCALAMGETGEAEELWRRSLERMKPATPRERRAAAELCLRLSRAAWQRRSGEQSLALAERGLLYESLPLLRAFQGLACLATGQAARGTAVLQAVLAEHAGSEAAALAEEALERGVQ